MTTEILSKKNENDWLIIAIVGDHLSLSMVEQARTCSLQTKSLLLTTHYMYYLLLLLINY